MQAQTVSLNEEHRNRINFAIQQGVGAKPWQFLSILGGGWTGACVYKIVVNDVVYVIKLDDTSNAAYNVVPGYTVLNEVSQRGISPHIYFANATYGVTLMEYIDSKARPLKITESTQPLASMLRNLHQCQPFPTGGSIYTILADFFHKLPDDYQHSSFIQERMNEANYIQQRTFDEQDIKSCHCDLTSNNILFDGNRFYLIDWQRASSEDFYFDLATCANFFYFFSDKLCYQFLKDYFGREPKKFEIQKFNLMRQFSYIYYGIISISISLQKKSELMMLSENDVQKLPCYSAFMLSLNVNKTNITNPAVQQKFGYISLNTSRKFEAAILLNS
jgi:predicted Ser/Thr protein kinase